MKYLDRRSIIVYYVAKALRYITEGGVKLIIASDLIRGNTDTIILAHLMRKDSYGYEINKNISIKTDGKYEFKEATLYTAFKRLEEAEYIISYWGNENVSARRRYYSITQKGKEAYIGLLNDWRNAKEMIEKLIDTGVVDNG
jgi:DNA-binding PadR family transcriptional regulator